MSTATTSTSIRVERQTLSDRSEVFNVWFGGVELDAITEKDAEALASGIAGLIAKHTNQTAETIFD